MCDESESEERLIHSQADRSPALIQSVFCERAKTGMRFLTPKYRGTSLTFELELFAAELAEEVRLLFAR